MSLYPHRLAPVVLAALCVASATGGVANAQPFDFEIDLSGLPTNFEDFDVFVEPNAFIIGFGLDIGVQVDDSFELADVRLLLRGPDAGLFTRPDFGDQVGTGFASTGGVLGLEPGEPTNGMDLRFTLDETGLLEVSTTIGTTQPDPGPEGVFLDGSVLTVRYIPTPGPAALLAGTALFATRRRCRA